MLSLLVGTGARSATRVERRTGVVVFFGAIFIKSNQIEQVVNICHQFSSPNQRF